MGYPIAHDPKEELRFARTLLALTVDYHDPFASSKQGLSDRPG